MNLRQLLSSFRRKSGAVFFAGCSLAATDTLAQTQVIIGTGVETNFIIGPVYRPNANLRQNNVRVYLYRESELAAAGIVPGTVINELAWHKANNGVLNNDAAGSLQVYMRNGVADTSYGTTLIADYVTMDYTQFISTTPAFQLAGSRSFDAGPANFPASAGWIAVPVSYYYTGGNLEIYCKWDLTPAPSGSVSTDVFNWSFTSTAPDITVLTGNVNVGVTPTSLGRNANRPNLRIDFQKPANNAGIRFLTDPENVCDGSYDIKVDVRNNGSNVINSLNLQWELGGIRQTDIPVSGVIDTAGSVSGNSRIVTLGNVTLSGNTGQSLKVWTTGPNSGTDVNNIDDTLTVVLRAGLRGTYTIGGVSPDFATIADAVKALNQFGVCGPTVMNIRPGNYTEQAILEQIAGTSAINTVTFRPETGNAGDVTISYSADGTLDNYVFILSNISHVRFKKLHFRSLNSNFGRIIEYKNLVFHIEVDSCHFETETITGSLINNAIIHLTYIEGNNLYFTNNTFLKGTCGIRYQSLEHQSDSVFIDHNVFQSANNYSVQAYRITNLKFRHNIVQNASAISTEDCGAGLTITHNKINANKEFGISVAKSVAMLSNPGIIANNDVVIGNGTGSVRGIRNSESSYQRIYNNSVNVISGSATNAYAGYFIYSDILHSQNDIRNNIFCNSTGGRVLYMANASATINNTWDYNNIYSSNPVLVYRGSPSPGVVITTLSNWRDSSGQELNSISYRPAFTSNTDLRPDSTDSGSWALNGRGVHASWNDRDMDGNPRSVIPATGVPDIGAYEFKPAAGVLPPAATATPATPLAGSAQVFTLGEDTVAVIEWTAGNNVPSGLTVRQYTGTIPPDLPSGPFMYFYTDVDLPAANYSYNTDIHYKDPWTGTVPFETALRMATKDGNNPWVAHLGTASNVDIVRNLITLQSVATGALFTGRTLDSCTLSVSLGEDTILCQDPIVLDAGPGADTYAWNTGSGTQTLSVAVGGIYWVEIIDHQGCVAADTIQITEGALPSVDGISFTGSGLTWLFTADNPANVDEFIWNFGDQPVSGGSSISHTFDTDGEYVVSLTVSNDCGTFTTSRTLNTSGIVDAGEGRNLFRLYPNPAGKFVVLKTSGKPIDALTVTDVTGVERIRLSGLSGTEINIATGSLTAGAYLVTVRIGGQIFTSRLIILE